jgi:hypothetical protein
MSVVDFASDGAEGIGEKVKAVPKPVWIVGIGIVVLLVFLKARGGGGGSTGVAAVGSATDGGGGGATDNTSLMEQFTDFVGETRANQAALTADEEKFKTDQAAAQTAFQNSVLAQIGKPVTNPVPAGAVKGLASITKRTNIYNSQHKVVGSVTKATYRVQKGPSHGGGYYWYKIVSTSTGGKTANAGKYILLKPSQVKG